MKRHLIFAILVTGFSGIVAQILLLRELLVTFLGNELSIGIILANWLFAEAIGSFFFGKKADYLKNRIGVFVCLTLLFSLFFPIAIYLARTLKGIIGVIPGEGLGFLPILYSSFIILLPTSLLHGALFTFSCKIHSDISHYIKYKQLSNATKVSPSGVSSIGKVYVLETVGTIAGAVIFTYLLIPYLHSFQIVAVVILLNFLASLFLMGHFWQTGKILPKVIGSSILVIFLLLSGYLTLGGGAGRLHQLSIKGQWRNQEVVHHQDSVYGNITVIKREGEYTFFTDGIPIITTPTPDIVFIEEFAHFPLLFHPHPQEILILSGGAGGLINEILKHSSVERIDYAELDPLILEVVRKFPTPLTEAELSDPRVNIKCLDSRLFVKKTQHKYDLILVGFSNPSDLQINRLFTKDFFSLAKNRLKEGGILVINLPSLPRANIHLRELNNLNASILNTLKAVYPYVRVIPGDSINLFLSSTSAEILSVNSTLVSQRLAERALSVRLLTAGYIEYRLQPWWQENFFRSIAGATERINLDFKPLGTFYSLSYWNALFSPYLRGLFRWFEKINLRLFFILFVLFTLTFLLIRLKIKRLFKASIPLCITSTGFAGMLFDLSLIFTFQALYGYAFYWLGLLIATFMVGVAVGGMTMTSLLPRIKRDFASFVKIELAIIGFSAMLPLIFFFFHPYLGRPAVFFLLQVVFIILSFISGLLVGVQFPLANKIYLTRSTKAQRPDLSRTVGLLYGADLFGGWIGGIVGGVILLPVLGLFGTCMVVVMFKISSLIILITTPIKGQTT